MIIKYDVDIFNMNKSYFNVCLHPSPLYEIETVEKDRVFLFTFFLKFVIKKKIFIYQ